MVLLAPVRMGQKKWNPSLSALSLSAGFNITGIWETKKDKTPAVLLYRDNLLLLNDATYKKSCRRLLAYIDLLELFAFVSFV